MTAGSTAAEMLADVIRRMKLPAPERCVLGGELSADPEIEWAELEIDPLTGDAVKIGLVCKKCSKIKEANRLF